MRAAERAIVRTRVGELAAAAVFGAMAGGVDAQGLGIFGGEPCRRRIGGRADDDGDVVLLGQADCALQPVEVVVAFGSLHAAPGELADADDVDAACSIRARSASQRIRPLLGIPGRAEAVVRAEVYCGGRLGDRCRAQERKG